MSHRKHNGERLPSGLFWIKLFSIFIGTEPARTQLQELEIKPLEQPAPGAFLDHPGRVVVIVRSSLATLNFSSSMEILEQRNGPAGGKYRIVISPENQILTVNAPGFISQGIQLRGLQPNDRVLLLGGAGT